MKPSAIKYYYRDKAPTDKKPRASALKHIVQYGRMRLRFTDEGIESLAVAQWMTAHGLFYIHIPNEGKRNRLEAICMKMLGLDPGAADYLIFDSPPKDPSAKGTAFEMKSKTGKITDNQITWLKKIIGYKWVSFVAYGADDAIQKLTELGYNRRQHG